jgi:hypothetical protein
MSVELDARVLTVVEVYQSPDFATTAGAKELRSDVVPLPQ